MIQARADKLFDTAVVSSGCDHPVIAENELFGAQTPTPWTSTTAQYRANVLAYLQRLAERGARPFLLLSNRPYTRDEVADEWWRDVAKVSDLVAETYFSGPSVSRQGAVAGSRRLRGTLRSRLEGLIQIGLPSSRLGVMLTFSSTPHAGGREGLPPLSRWLDVVKWEALAARQVASELRARERLDVGVGGLQPGRERPRQADRRVHVALGPRPRALRRAVARGLAARPVARRRGGAAGRRALPARDDEAALVGRRRR